MSYNDHRRLNGKTVQLTNWSKISNLLTAHTQKRKKKKNTVCYKINNIKAETSRKFAIHNE